MVAASDIKLYVMLAVYDKQHAGTLATGGKPCSAGSTDVLPSVRWM